MTSKTMNNIKYTTDGKKVVVIGDLNQTEKIVQEIFVTEDGAEIPSGERFVVKSLLDEPAKSWKEKNLIELESSYEKESKEWERKSRLLNQEKRFAYDALSARVKWLKQVAREPHPEKLKRVVETLAMFLSDAEKWILWRNYSSWNLQKFNEDGSNNLIDSVDYHGSCRFDSMRLLSLYGKSNGDFEYRINDYSDGSGSDNKVMFFKSKQEAIDFMQSEINKLDTYTQTHADASQKYGLKLNEAILLKHKMKQAKYIKDDIENMENNLARRKTELSEILKP